jgi:hypothetical protein
MPKTFSFATGAFYRRVLAVFLALACVPPAVADVAPGRRPRPRPADDALSTLTLKIDATTEAAELRIPERLLKQMKRAGADTGFALPAGRTILAGLAMSLAAISLALVIRARRAERSRALKVAAGSLVAVAVTFSALGIALADIAPPPNRASGVVLLLQPVKEADGVTLILPAAMLPELHRIIGEADEAADSYAPAPDAKVEKPAPK